MENRERHAPEEGMAKFPVFEVKEPQAPEAHLNPKQVIYEARKQFMGRIKRLANRHEGR